MRRLSPRTVVAGAAALALVGAGVAATSSDADASFAFTRVAGQDRFETAVALAQSFGSPSTVIIANGQDKEQNAGREHFPDALAASYLAGSLTAPILLTTETAIPGATRDYLNAKKPANVVIVGGTVAVSSGQEQSLATAGFKVTRIAGFDRYETAQKIAAQPGPSYVGSVDGAKTAILASGTRFPDALVAGPLAYAGKLPVVLTLVDALPDATKASLQSNGIKNVLIAGGTGVVSTAVESQLKSMGITVDRRAGTTRSGTGKAIAEYAVAKLGFDKTTVDLATGSGFADALTGGPFAGRTKTPILITEDLNTLGEAQTFLAANSGTLRSGTIFGGTAAVTASAAAQATKAAQTGVGAGSPAAATSRPELLSASITNTSASGTAIRFVFDATVSSPAFAKFHAYTASGRRLTAATATVGSDKTSVDALFGETTTMADADRLSVATVETDAVTGDNAQTSPAGDAPLGSAARTVAGGTTSQPDLIAVRATRSTSGVDFIFDQPANLSANSANGFNLVNRTASNPLTGATVKCVPTTPPTGASSTVPTMCSGTVDLTAIARAYVGANSVSATSASMSGNPLEAVDVSFNGNTTDSPNLVSAAIRAGTNGGSGFVDYTFDRPVTTGLPMEFAVYHRDGSEATGTSPTGSTSNPNVVSVTFASADLQTAVGASVNNGAVTSTSGMTPNQPDEVSFDGPVTVAPGQTTAPDLVNITTSNGQATYTFDSTVTFTGTAANLRLYQPDGTELQCNAANSTASSSTVTCTQFTVVASNGSRNNATADQVSAAVEGTVANDTVRTQGSTAAGSDSNPEGASLTGTGTSTTPSSSGSSTG